MPHRPSRKQKLAQKKTPFLKRLASWFYRHHYVSAFLLGAVYYGVVISWMFGLRTAEIATGVALIFVAFTAALIMVASLAVGPVLFVWTWHRLRLSIDDQRVPWLIPVIWVLAEYFRSVFFSVVSSGPGGRIGPYWNFGNIGYWLLRTPLVYAARWGGLFLLTAMMATLIVAAVIGFRQKNWRPLLIVLGVSGLLSFMGWLAYRTPNGKKIDVTAVQFDTEFNPTKFSNTAGHLLLDQPAQSADVVYLPEYSHLWEINPAQDSAAVRHVLRSDAGLVIDSTQEHTTGIGHNLVSYHAADGSLKYTQQKWFSIPGGEYVPYVYQVILAYAGQEQLLLNFDKQKSIEHGDNPEQPYMFDGVNYGALACSASIVPEIYRGMTDRGATILSNSASLDTLGVSDMYHTETRDMAQLHAIANNRPFVQVARGGLSYIIDNNGHYLAHTNQKGYELIHANVQTNSTKTVYTMLGDWVVWLSGALALVNYGTILRSHWTARKLAKTKKHAKKT